MAVAGSNAFGFTTDATRGARMPGLGACSRSRSISRSICRWISAISASVKSDVDWRARPRGSPASSSSSLKTSRASATRPRAGFWRCAVRGRLRARWRQRSSARGAAFLQVVDQLPELLGRERPGPAPGGRLADAVGRTRRRSASWGSSRVAMICFDPGIGILISEGEDERSPR